MKNFLFFILGSLLILGCYKDDLKPRHTIGEIFTEKGKVYLQGDLLVLKATFKSLAGMERIEIVNQKLGIDFEENLLGEQEYDLRLERTLPLTPAPAKHKLLITLTDVEGEVDKFSYEVDYAFQPKIDNIEFNIDKNDNSIRYLRGRLEDPHGLKSLSLHSLSIGEMINIQFPEDVQVYDLNEGFWFPPELSLTEYPMTLQIKNYRGINLTIIDFRDILGD